MKKTILIGMLTAISFAVFPQSGIKVITPLPTQNSIALEPNTVVKVKTLFYIAGSKQLQIETYSTKDGENINTTYPGNVIILDSVDYNLSTAYLLIKQYLISKGLTVEDL